MLKKIRLTLPLQSGLENVTMKCVFPVRESAFPGFLREVEAGERHENKCHIGEIIRSKGPRYL